MEGAIHELMHAMGFMHEQSRPDRDTAVRVDLNKVQRVKESQYNKNSGTGFYSRNYDVRSIMQYESGGFAINPARCNPNDESGCPMTTLNGGYIPRRLSMTNLDALVIKAAYQLA